METAVKSALKQMNELKYESELVERGIDHPEILIIGMEPRHSFHLKLQLWFYK